MIFINISKEYLSQINQELIQRAAHATISHLPSTEPVDLTIVLTNNDKIQELNKNFRGIDTPTDVLSFPSDHVDPDTGMRYVGDVIISYPYCQEQATLAGHTIDDELHLLVIHGTLHLFGYDHMTIEDRTQMWSIQREILSEIGLSGSILPEDE